MPSILILIPYPSPVSCHSLPVYWHAFYFITLRFFAKLPEKSVKKVFYLIKETLVLLAWVRLEGLFVPKGFDDFLLLF